MRNQPPWGVSVLALIIAAQPVMMTSASAQQTTTVNTTVANWSNPGSYPFTGDFSDVCELYRHTLTDEQCLRALSQYEADIADTSTPDVGTVMYLQDGDILQISFTVGGIHQQKTLRVAFGATVPPNDPRRRAVVYETGRSDGAKLLRPDVCGNWSIMTIPDAPPPPAEPVTVIQRVYGPREICTVPEAFTLVTPGQYVPGFGHPDGCGCGLHVPGIFVGGETVPTFSSPICYTVNPEPQQGD